ncbi:MAG: cell division protein FtsZ [Anaerolineales bacterium]
MAESVISPLDETSPRAAVSASQPWDALRPVVGGPRPEPPSVAQEPRRPIVKVMGLGGGGSNAINRMIEIGVSGVEYIAANTDKQALASSLARVQIQLGPQITRGLGAGGDPRMGAAAAMESSKEIAQALAGADMVFLTAGMGGGTGTGAAAVAAEIAREIGAVVIAIVTLPFGFEMSRRSQNAQVGVRALQPHTHTLITVPNDRLLQVVPKDVSLEIAFRLADDVLRQGIQGISELITRPGLINVDFAHVRRLMMRGGGALMSIGLGEGPDKAKMAVQEALHHPLLEIDSLDQANGVLVDFVGGEDLTLHEIGEAVAGLRDALPDEAEIIVGAGTEESLEGRAQVILIVTGLAGKPVATHGSQTQHAEPFDKLRAGFVEGRPGQESSIAVLAGGTPQEEDLDIPAFMRRRAAVSG